MAQNNEMNLAWQLVTSTGRSVFLTGKAGTGKTTFLRKMRESSPKRMVVLAPTGVAAINAGGQTIHSFFQLPFGPIVPGMSREQSKMYRMSQEKKNLIKTLDLLVIDEISMVRCDLLDAVDAELRKYKNRSKPFGGVQLLLIGDLQQLAPVAKDGEWQLLQPYYSTPYFFGSKALQSIPYVTVELKHIYRQQDEAFISLLGRIRNNNIDSATIQSLNARYQPGFVPPEGEGWIRLTTHNRMADEYNDHMLASLQGRERSFVARVKGNFPESSYPADAILSLKKGAQVMFIKNDPSGAHSYYNGKIGVVRDFDDDEIIVWSQEDDSNIAVPMVEWQNTKYAIDDKTKEIKEEVDGTFMQYPLRLAWAITVHKSQGLTFDHAVLDINESFAHGQAYVALSRCRTLEGMVLARPVDVRSVITDASVDAFMDKELAAAQQVELRLPQMMREYYLTLLDEAFSFTTLYSDLQYLTRVADEHLYNIYPDFLASLKGAIPAVKRELIDVSIRFAQQYRSIIGQATCGQDEALQERLYSAMIYFGDKVHTLLHPVISASVLKIENQQVSTQYNNALDAFRLSYRVKAGVFSRLAEEPFTVKNYLSAKAKAALDEIPVKASRASSRKVKAPKVPKAANEPKAPKVDTKYASLRLYENGMTIKEIAEARELKPATIENHLAYFVAEGVLDVNDFVPIEHQRAIHNVVLSFDRSYTLSDIKAKLPDIPYLEIKMTLATE